MRIHFGRFTLDDATRQLMREGRAIHVSPKAFELLTVLLTQRPRALSKADLQERLWPATFVAEANLSNLIGELRSALGDQSRPPVFIRTVHRFGYAFCGDATITDTARSRTMRKAPSFYLTWGLRRIPLVSGDNVVGRDPSFQVTLDASTISRRHAKITVTTVGAVLEDLGSKNGTFLAGERLRAPALLRDGDLVGFGSLVMNFHEGLSLLSTETQHSSPPTA